MDEDDAFLYGDSAATEAPKEAAAAAPAVEPSVTQGDGEEVDMDAGSSDDESQDLEIIVDADPSKPPPPPAFDPRRQTHHRTLQPGTPSVASAPVQPLAVAPLPVATTVARPTSPPIPFPVAQEVAPTVDPTAPVLLQDNTSLFDVDIDSLETKPWRAAGAVNEDYFNYGFNEASWKIYVQRQRTMRDDRASEKEKPFKIFADLPLQEAWQSLPPELKGMMMNTIMSSMPGGMNPMAMMMGGFPGMMPPGMPQGMPPGMPQGIPPGMPQGMLPGIAPPAAPQGDNGWGDRPNKKMKYEDGSEAPEEQEFDDHSWTGEPSESSMGMGRGRGAARGGRGGKGNNPFGIIPPSIIARGQQAASRSTPDATNSPHAPKSHSPLPPNIPTGPRRAPASGPPPTGPRSERNKHYKDQDADTNSRSAERLDYGETRGGRSESRDRLGRTRRRSYSSEDDYDRRRHRKRSRSRSYDSRN